MKSSYLNLSSIDKALTSFHGADPFDHCFVDDFFFTDIANQLESEFLSFDSDEWFVYKNAIEDKKALNNWNAFGPLTYKVFAYLNSDEFISYLSDKLKINLYPDVGLHGGGWHIHDAGGNLNPHVDYSIHPKLGLERRINIIMYMSSALINGMGGELGLWRHDPINDQPGELAKVIEPKFNRAVIFDTTQNSWHGMANKLNCPLNIFRKSLAIYYVCEPSEHARGNVRAVFAPRQEQKNDRHVKQLILDRSDIKKSSAVYIDKNNS